MYLLQFEGLLFFSSFLFLSTFFALFLSDLMTVYNVMFAFVPLSCVRIYYRFLGFMVTLKFIYSNLYVYMIIFISLNFESILTTLNFYSPIPCLFFLTSYFTSFCFLYPFTYYRYRLFYFCLLTFLLDL